MIKIKGQFYCQNNNYTTNEKVDAHISDNEKHITFDERTKWNDAAEKFMDKNIYDTNNDGIVDKSELALDSEKLGGKSSSDFIPAITSATLLSASWAENTYSFETEYPSNQYNIEIQPSEQCDYEQLSTWCNALIIGSSTENVITALGDIPTVDIPIMIKAVMK